MSGMSPQDESSDLSGLAGLYALDALEGDARLRFEAQLGTSPELRAEVSDYRATAARLANISAINPPSDLRARVLSEVGDTRQDSPVVRLDSQPTRSSTRRTAISSWSHPTRSNISTSRPSSWYRSPPR